MNQIKYLVYACLMILTFVIVGFFLSLFFSKETVPSDSTVINTDVSEPAIVNSKGSDLFRQNCQTCHALDKNLTGPALRGVEERGPWTDRKNLIEWVKNPAIYSNYALYKRITKAIPTNHAFVSSTIRGRYSCHI